MAIGTAIAEQLKDYAQYSLCCPVGTGSTLTGLIASSPNANCIGFSVLKGSDSLSSRVERSLQCLGRSHKKWQLMTEFHQGGYGKITPQLLKFMAEFERRNQVLIEPVYTAKMLWGIEQLAKRHFWQKGSVVVAIHTGGLQGRRGYQGLATL